MATFIHGKSTKILCNAFDLSTFFRDFSLSTKVDTAETSTFGTQTKSYVSGLDEDTLQLQGLYDGSANAVDQILNAAIGATTDTVIVISPNGLYTVGTRVIAGQAIEAEYTAHGAIGSVVEVSASFTGDNGLRPGVSLHDLVAETATGNSASVQNLPAAAATTNGSIAVLQVTANTMNNTTAFKIQHSADNSTWADLVAFTAIAATTAGGYQSAIVGVGTTINQYVRASWTPAGTGSITFQISFVRL